MDTKWAVKSVVLDSDLSIRKKYTKIANLLTTFNKQFKEGDIAVGLKGRIYLFLFKYHFTLGVLLLETALVNDIRRLLPIRLVNWLIYRTSRSSKFDDLKKDEKKIIVFLVPDLGNLGDLAIGVAQKTFLEQRLKGYRIIEVPFGETYKDLRALKSHMSRDDIVMLTGGGNLGTLYKDAEAQRRFIIRAFPRNKIVLFPQSAYFEDSKFGRSFLQKSVRLYGAHRNLTLFARDELAYAFMKRHFERNTVALLPDTVLYLSPLKNVRHLERNEQITLSVRRDIESNIGTSQKKVLQAYVAKLGMQLVYKDTNIDNVHHALDERQVSLDDVWGTYFRSRVVITDRLHGVIFCVITKTPCIAINNKNGKVFSLCKTWLKDVVFISAINRFDVNLIKQEMDRLLALPVSASKSVKFEKEFEQMRDIILK
jgi:pyruvyl transferase EpsI